MLEGVIIVVRLMLNDMCENGRHPVSENLRTRRRDKHGLMWIDAVVPGWWVCKNCGKEFPGPNY